VGDETEGGASVVGGREGGRRAVTGGWRGEGVEELRTARLRVGRGWEWGAKAGAAGAKAFAFRGKTEGSHRASEPAPHG